MSTKNTPGDIIKYFSANTNKPLSFSEAMAFWQSLTFRQKWYFEHVNLRTGLISLEEPSRPVNPHFIEKCCSVCGKITWDSETGDYKEKHVVFVQGQVSDVSCDTKGNQYWEYTDGLLELRKGNGSYLRDIN